MRSAFVTGAYGLLGTAIVRVLLDEGVDVTVLRRDVRPRSPLVLEGLEDRVDVVAGDITDLALVDRTLGEYEVDTVFHLAAQTIVGTAQRSPLGTWEANIRGTYMVLEACRHHDVPRVVVAASDKAYGAHRELPYRESMALQPKYPYDVSKAATDLIARSYWHTYGLPVATTRFANLYGGGDTNRSRLVPEAVVAALRGRAPIIRSDGTPERDFLYVDDAAAAYLALARALSDEDGGVRGEAFNAGGGEPHAVRDVVALICSLAGTDVRPDIRGQGTPRGEIDRQYVDTSKLRARTGWIPEVSLEEGLRRTIDWYRQHPEALDV
jgi:CDP-glucose 4,6-dehydratase